MNIKTASKDFFCFFAFTDISEHAQGTRKFAIYIKKCCNYSAYQKQLIDIDFYVIGTSDY